MSARCFAWLAFCGLLGLIAEGIDAHYRVVQAEVDTLFRRLRP